MKNLCLAFLLALGPCASLSAQQASLAAPEENPALKSQLVAQLDAFMRAWEAKDAATLAATMAPEFLYVTSRGVTSKAGVVTTLTQACTLTSYRLSDVRVLPISTDSATLVYKITQTVSCMGHPDSPVVLNTDTLVRRDGRWLFLMTTSTPAQ